MKALFQVCSCIFLDRFVSRTLSLKSCIDLKPFSEKADQKQVLVVLTLNDILTDLFK